MRANRPRPKRPKTKLDIDSLLSTVEKNLYEKKTSNKRYLTITYVGYYDDKSNYSILMYFFILFMYQNIIII